MQSSIRQKVLVVEDDPLMSFGLTRRLTRASYDVTPTRTGRSAIHYAESLRPAIITLDVRLPDMDGLTVAKELARDQQTANIPIIFITGVADPHLTDELESNGRHYFIRKPYDGALLVRLMNSLLACDELSEIQRISQAKRRQPVNGSDSGAFLSDFRS